MTQKPSLELRIYRYLSVTLLAVMTSIAAYVADAALAASTRLPAIEQQLIAINGNLGSFQRNLDKIEDLPVQVKTNSIKIDDQNKRIENHDQRLARLENSRNN